MRRWAIIVFVAFGLALPVQAGDEEEAKKKEEQEEKENGEGINENRHGPGLGRGRGHGWGRRNRHRHRRGRGRRRGRERGRGRELHHSDKPELHPVRLVQELLNEDRLDEAEKLLAGLEGDQAVLLSFRGILAMKRNLAHEAIPHFRKVLSLKPNQTAVWLYLGQAYFQTEKYPEAIDALIRGKKVGQKIPSYFQLRARVEDALGRPQDAYETLERALQRFPDEHELLREEALLLVNEGLYLAALEKGQEYLAWRPEDRNGYLIMGEALRSAGRPREAAVILEGAVLRFNQDQEVLARLAFSYAKDRRWLAAARLFTRATCLGGDFAYEAAEHFRLAGKLQEALQQNALVQDFEKLLRQRLALYIGAERFARAAALDRLLVASQALDDTTRYRLAYAHLRTGNLDRAKDLCLQVRDPALEESTAKILEAVTEQRGMEGQPSP